MTNVNYYEGNETPLSTQHTFAFACSAFLLLVCSWPGGRAGGARRRRRPEAGRARRAAPEAPARSAMKIWGVGFNEDRFWGGGGGGREWVVLVVGNENWEVKWWILKEGKVGR